MNTDAHGSTDAGSSQHEQPGLTSQDSDKPDTSGTFFPGCIAIIGLDGAGKTTIARLLLDSSAQPMKYLYMGTAIGSSNFALPTSRLAHYLKTRKAKALPSGQSQKLRSHKRKDKRGKIGAAFRLLHRLSEEWYRQLISWTFQLRGYLVLYDRHFIFECAPRDNADQKQRRLGDRIHFWLLWHAYPRPRFIFFLDAPPEVLFERKPEATLEYLAERRRTYLRLGAQMPNFLRIDATQPVDEVLAEIKSYIDPPADKAADMRDQADSSCSGVRGKTGRQ